MTYTPFSKKNQMIVSLIIPFYNEKVPTSSICVAFSAVARVPTVTNDLVVPAGRSEGFGFGLEIVDRVVARLGRRFENEQTASQWRATLYFAPKP